MSKYIITGIGTEIGKTAASAIMTESLNADYWKPVQSGANTDSDTLTVKSLISNNKSKFHSEAYSLAEPLSPHEAAALENIEINLENIIVPDSEFLIIEGAGGIMVPLNDTKTFIDLFKRFNIPVVLVIKHYLGAINHTLMSIEVLQRNKIEIAGLIYNGGDHFGNEYIINKKSGLPVIGRIAQEPILNKEVVKRYALEFKNNFDL